MSNYKTSLYCLFFFFYFFIAGCKEESQGVVILSQPVQNGNKMVLNWKAENIKGFRYYSILRVTDGQHYVPINNIDSTGSDAFKQNITSYTDTSFPYVDSIYYKIQVFGDEIISSTKMCVHIMKPFTTDQPITSAYFMPDSQKALIYTGYSNGQMNLYNFSTGLIENSVKVYFLYGAEVGYGKYNGNYEFYFYDDRNAKFSIYDAKTMNLVSNMSEPENYPGIISDKNGNIFMYSSYSTGITIIDRQQLADTLNYYNVSTMKYNKDKNTILTIYNNL